MANDVEIVKVTYFEGNYSEDPNREWEYVTVRQDASLPPPPDSLYVAQYGDTKVYSVANRIVRKSPICPCGIDRRDCEYHK